ncbi:hypothetical protein C8F01DRAFT_1134766 [Mycena amicta]|nr:hypothetical protein C8F01DRAFT_1134766 [Mycena amicta]
MVLIRKTTPILGRQAAGFFFWVVSLFLPSSMASVIALSEWRPAQGGMMAIPWQDSAASFAHRTRQASNLLSTDERKQYKALYTTSVLGTPSTLRSAVAAEPKPAPLRPSRCPPQRSKTTTSTASDHTLAPSEHREPHDPLPIPPYPHREPCNCCEMLVRVWFPAPHRRWLLQCLAPKCRQLLTFDGVAVHVSTLDQKKTQDREREAQSQRHGLVKMEVVEEDDNELVCLPQYDSFDTPARSFPSNAPALASTWNQHPSNPATWSDSDWEYLLKPSLLSSTVPLLPVPMPTSSYATSSLRTPHAYTPTWNTPSLSSVVTAQAPYFNSKSGWDLPVSSSLHSNSHSLASSYESLAVAHLSRPHLQYHSQPTSSLDFSFRSHPTMNIAPGIASSFESTVDWSFLHYERRSLRELLNPEPREMQMQSQRELESPRSIPNLNSVQLPRTGTRLSAKSSRSSVPKASLKPTRSSLLSTSAASAPGDRGHPGTRTGLKLKLKIPPHMRAGGRKGKRSGCSARIGIETQTTLGSPATDSPPKEEAGGHGVVSSASGSLPELPESEGEGDGHCSSTTKLNSDADVDLPRPVRLPRIDLRVLGMPTGLTGGGAP